MRRDRWLTVLAAGAFVWGLSGPLTPRAEAADLTIKLGWAPWGDVPTLLKIWDQASYIGEACSSVYQPWHFPWTDQLNIEVQKCLTGQITPDQCCDNLIKGIADAKRKV